MWLEKRGKVEGGKMKKTVFIRRVLRGYIQRERVVQNPQLNSNTSYFLFFLKEVWINYNRIHLILCIFFQHFQTKSGTSTLSLPQNDRFLSLEWMGSVILIHEHVCSENVQLDCTELRLDEILTHLNISNKNCSEMIHVFILLSIF